MDTQNIVSVIGSGTMGNGIAHVFSMCPKVKQVFLYGSGEEEIKFRYD